MPRLLVVDDEEGFRAFFRYALEPLGIEVALAATGAEALALAERGDFDGVLLDRHLGSVSGVEVLRRLRALKPGLKVAVLSVTEGLHEEDALADGAWGELAKPTTPKDLRALVARLLA